MKYFFTFNDGRKKEMTEEECYNQIENITGLDSAMITICLDQDGIDHPAGKWTKED